ncbi:MAG: hypothetical protein PHY93_18060 [Bacteriovorax sp.]|nr:hypothetical protein [Bacteriovorax sp.]
MNQFLQNNLVPIVVFLLLLIFLLMGGMIFILFRLLTTAKNEPTASTPLEKPVLRPVADKVLLAEKPVVENYYCIHHKDAPSVGSCLICEEVFCADCLVDHESMHFCKEHFRTYANYKWKQITDVRTTPDTPEDGLFIYNFKRDLWLNKSIPSFVMTHYKINIENDYIESFIQLNVREDDVEKLTLELEKYKALD